MNRSHERVRLWGGPWLLEAQDDSAPTPLQWQPEKIQWQAEQVDVPEGKHLHWVVLETGSNQAFVFASNRRRANVGASRLIKMACTTWVDDAVGERTAASVTVVVRASGKTILLVADKDTGKAVVRAVTKRALKDAPGLDIWGVVQEVGCPEECCHATDECRLKDSLKEAHATLRQVRMSRPHPAQRAARTPFTEPCRLTDMAATTTVSFGSGAEERKMPVSAQLDACLRAGRETRKGDAAEWPGVHQELDQDLGSTWVAVLHADGNGVGELIRNLDAAPDKYLPTLKSLSSGIEAVTLAAVGEAARLVQKEACSKVHREEEEFCKRGFEEPTCRWWLPLVIGGDDVTVLLRGDLALGFTEQLLDKFRWAAKSHVWPESVNGVSLSMSAGLAFVKPHHPFNQAYDLAEELCNSAKDLSRHPGVAAIDAHVLYDSVAQPLTRLRRVSKDPGSIPGGLSTTWEAAHDFKQLKELIGKFTESSAKKGGDNLSSRRLHAIRSALILGGASLADAREAITHDEDSWKTDWIDALSLADVARSAGWA